MDEPIFGLREICDTAEIIAMHSIPQVSGIHMESRLYLERILVHSSTSLIDNSEPKLNPILKGITLKGIFRNVLTSFLWHNFLYLYENQWNTRKSCCILWHKDFLFEQVLERLCFQYFRFWEVK